MSPVSRSYQTILCSVCQSQGESSNEECSLPSIPVQSSFSTLPPVRSGVQAILPYYRFRCNGVINQILVQTKGESTRLDIQLWREGEGRTYFLKWTATFSANEQSVFQELQPPNADHEGSLLVFHSLSGVPVSKGDLLGYYIERNDYPVHLGFVNTANDPDAQHSIHMLENVSGPLCGMPLYDAGLKTINHTAPLIHIEFGKFLSQWIQLKY